MAFLTGDIFIVALASGAPLRRIAYLILLLVCVVGVSAQPTAKNLGTPVISMTIWGRLLVRDPVTGRPTFYAGTYTGAGSARLIRFDYTMDEVEYYTLAGVKGGYGLCEGLDGKIYVGTVQDGRIFSFDPATKELKNLGSAAGETYVWTLQTGPDGRIYGATYPNAKAVAYDPSDGRFYDLGRMHPTEQYCRDLAVADNGRIFCGIGSHADLVAYDPSTDERRSILPERYKDNSFAYVVESDDDIVYAFLHFDQIILIFDANTYELLMEVRHPEEGKGVYLHRQMSGEPAVITGLPDGWKRYNKTTGQLEPFQGQAYSYYDRETGIAYSGGDLFEAWNMTSGELLSSVDVRKDGEGMKIFSLGTGPDGCIYGGVYNLLHLFRYDPLTDKLEDLGNPISSSGEFYSFHVLDEKLYMASYTYSVLSVYDPSKAWNPGNSNESNPRRIGPVGDEQYRPPGLVSAADGRIYIGSLPAYGKMGGALSSYDPRSDEFAVHRHIIPNQSVVSLTTSLDGWIVYGGSSISGGGGTVPIEDEAHFFAWDVREGKKILDIVPVKGQNQIQSLATAADGKIYGCAGGTLFVYDPQKGEVIHKEGSPVGYITRMIPWKDGLIYGISSGSVFCMKPMSVDTQDIGFERLHSGGVDMAIGYDGRIYFGRDTDLYVLENMPIYQPPSEDLKVYGDNLEQGWTLQSGRAEVDLLSKEKVTSGRCQKVSFDRFCALQYFPPDPWAILPWEYDKLVLQINPGNATLTDIIATKTGRGSTASVSLFKDLQVNLLPEEWTSIEVPVEVLKWMFGSRLESLRLTFLGSGTFYLDSIQLALPESGAFAILPTGMFVGALVRYWRREPE